MKVVILAGGRSSHRDVSLNSAEAIRAAALAAEHDVLMVSIDRAGAWLYEGARLSVCPGGGLLGCDVVFPALQGQFGEDGTVQGLLESLDVPYVGAGVLASSLCADRAAFKGALSAAGIPHVRYLVVPERWWRRAPVAVHAQAATLTPPLSVKPSRLGSAVASARIADDRELPRALETAFTQDGVAVVEEVAPGVEIECAVMGLADPVTSVPGQIVSRGAEWHDYRANSTHGGYTLTAPAPIPEAVAEDVRRLSRQVFLRVGCSGLARVDLFVDGERLFVDQVHTLPGFTPTSDFPRLWEASGVDLASLCERLLGYALERFRVERSSHTF